MGVNVVKLGDFVKIQTGKLDANAADENGLYPFFTCAVEPLSINTYAYDCECILIAGNGDLNVKYYKGKFNAYQRTYIIEVIDKNLDIRYLYHFLTKYINVLRQNSIGGVIKYIKLGDLTGIKLPLPPLEEQKKIVSILDKADEIRQKKRVANDKLDEFLKSTFISMFGDPVRNTKNFQVKLLKDISTIISGGTPSRQHKEYFGGNIPWVTTVALGKNYIDRNDAQDYLTELGVEKSATHIIPKNSLLFGSRVGVGKTSVNLCDICTNQDILSITNIDSDMFNMTFIKKVLEQYTAYFETQKRGATIKGISADVVKNINIPIAPIDLQNKYLRIVEKVEAQKQKNELVIEQMDNLFNSLSQRAFKGEL